MNLGLPYMGSKNKIARKIVDVLPSGSVFVSEYSMPSEFTEIWSTSHRSILSGTANNGVVERLFCNRALARHCQLDLFGEYAA